MEKITKEKTPITNIMSLEFFARHFEFPVEALQWGIVRVTTPDEKTNECAVLVEGINLYISVMYARIWPCLNTSRVQFELIPCQVYELEDEFLFSANEGKSLIINKRKLAEYYCDKVYSTETTKYLLGAYTPW